MSLYELIWRTNLDFGHTVGLGVVVTGLVLHRADQVSIFMPDVIAPLATGRAATHRVIFLLIWHVVNIVVRGAARPT